MAVVTCPECGQVSEIKTIRKSAEEFCSHCDYPLFWARSAATGLHAGAGGPGEATLRRLPGAGGRVVVGTKVCPVCGELNPLAQTHCLRCGSDLDPRPPEPAPEPAPPPRPAPVFVPPPPPDRRWLLVLVAAVIVLATVLVIWLLAR